VEKVAGAKNNIVGILVVLLVTALLAVPILAKQDKRVQGADLTAGLSEAKSPSFEKAKVKDSVDFDISSDSTIIKEVKQAKGKNSQTVGSSEKLRHNIKMNGLFQEQAAGADASGTAPKKVKLEKVDGKMAISLPKGSETKEQAKIKLRDLSGEEIAELVADFGQLTESEMDRIGKGDASLRSIRSLRLVSKEKEVAIKDSKGNDHRIKAHIDVGLSSINEGSSLDITTNNELDEEVNARFDRLAKEKKLKLADRGGVMKIDKVELNNGQEVQDANITFKVEPEWVGQDNVNNVRIFRYDEGYAEVLPTTFAGIDEEGLLIFEGESSKGLSTFAVFMTDTMTEMDDTSFDFGKMKAFLLPLLIIVTVGAAFVGSFMVKHEK
jgi:competence protein ComGC